MQKIRFYYVRNDYIDFLRKYDSKVPLNKNETRPFIGIVCQVDDIKYYAPLTSPKKKHIHMKNTIDFRKIDNGRLGAINFNNMIPITDEALIHFSFENINDKRYRMLLSNQYEAILQMNQKYFDNLKQLRQICFKDDSCLSSAQRKIKKRCNNKYNNR